ncbi:unnamed protein product [Trichobilharzia szidati]|nr:unnamed protein product [Trichobilharzia szidati]
MSSKVNYHTLSPSKYKLKYFMKPKINQLGNGCTIFPRQLRVYSLFSFIAWLFLIGTFLYTTLQLCSLLLKQSSFSSNAYSSYYGKNWIPSIYTVSQLSDAIINIWPANIANNIMPSYGLTLVSFSNQTPFPYTDQLKSVIAFDEREQSRVFLSSVHQGLITRLIWVYPSWKQISVDQFYKKAQYHVGLANINLLEHETDLFVTGMPMSFTTFCLCTAFESLCSLPLLSLPNLRISRQSCSVNGSFIYEEVIDLMVESLLSEEKTKATTKDSIYLFSRTSFINSDNIISSSSSSSSSKRLTPWLDNPFLLHIDMNYFIGSVTSPNDVAVSSTINVTSPSQLAPAFIEYLHANTLSESNNNSENNNNNSNKENTQGTLRDDDDNEYYNSDGVDYFYSSSHVDQMLNASSHHHRRDPTLIHQYITLVKNLFNKLFKFRSIEKIHLLDKLNQLISAMLFLMNPQNSNMLSNWSNETLILHTACCTPSSLEPLLFDTDIKVDIFNQWKKNFHFAFYYVDNYCSYSTEIIKKLLSLSLGNFHSKEEIFNLWNWLCSLTKAQLKFIGQFLLCTYQSNSNIHSLGLCERQKSTILSFNGIPITQRNSLTLHRLKNIFTYLPRPIIVNVVMHPYLGRVIHKMHLPYELCNMLNQTYSK